MAQHPATLSQPQIPTLGSCLPAKLSDPLRSRDSAVVGPDTASQLRAITAGHESPMPDQSEIETMIGKLAMATAARRETYWLGLRDVPIADLRAAFVDLIQRATFLLNPCGGSHGRLSKGQDRRYAKSRARHLARPL